MDEQIAFNLNDQTLINKINHTKNIVYLFIQSYVPIYKSVKSISLHVKLLSASELKINLQRFILIAFGSS